MTRQRAIQSVDRALNLLEMLSSEENGLSLRELSARTGLCVQTVQGLLRTLELHDLVEQPKHGAPYRIGSGLSRLLHPTGSRRRRGLLAEPVVTRLVSVTQESALLAEWSGRQLAAVVNIQANQVLAVNSRCEFFSMLHTMSTGKLLLAHLPEKQREHILSELELPARTEFTITGREAFRRHLEEIRIRGYAESFNESNLGVAATAVPVSDAGGRVIAALGICLPSLRYRGTRPKTLRNELYQAAEEICRIWQQDDETAAVNTHGI